MQRLGKFDQGKLESDKETARREPESPNTNQNVSKSISKVILYTPYLDLTSFTCYRVVMATFPFGYQSSETRNLWGCGEFIFYEDHTYRITGNIGHSESKYHGIKLIKTNCKQFLTKILTLRKPRKETDTDTLLLENFLVRKNHRIIVILENKISCLTKQLEIRRD